MTIMGRPSKLTAEIARKIVGGVRRGLSQSKAAQAAGIAPSTLSEWLRRGREGEPGYRAFLARVERAWLQALVEKQQRIFAAVEKRQRIYAAWVSSLPPRFGPNSTHRRT